MDELELLKRQMAEVRSALGSVALAVDDNPWASTHADLLGMIGSVTDERTRVALLEFFKVIGILNTKMVDIFAALKPISLLDPEFLRLVAAQKAFILTSRQAQEDPAVAIALLADAVREVAARHYAELLANRSRTVASDMEAAIESLA